VEEGALYCRQCGTQLLFPEDENIEEDIPGEKIILNSEEKTEEEIIFDEELAPMEEENRKDQKITELSEEKLEIRPGRSRRERRLKKGIEMEKEEEKLSSKEEKSKKEIKLEEEIEGIEEEEIKEEEGEKKEVREEEEEEEEENYFRPEEPTLEFPTAELDRLTRSVDEGQKKIEDFLEFLKEKAVENSDNNVLAQDKKREEKLESVARKEEELPPWAEAIRDRVETEVPSATDVSLDIPEGYPFKAEEETWRQKSEEMVSYPDDSALALNQPPWQVDSGVGLPEKPGQQPLPFEVELRGWEEEREDQTMREERRDSLRAKRIKGEEEEEENEEMTREEEKADLATEEKIASRPFFIWLKAKLFDLLFVGLIWFIALVLAARIISWSFFSLIGAASYQAGALFLLLFGGYLFLFRFFIGETLGDRLFSPGD
jgi:hypothetical protein